MARTLGRLRADLVHCADVTSALQVVLAGRMAGIPVVSHVRNPYPRLPLRYRPVFRGISRFVFVSHHTRESFAFRVPDARSVVIYDGIDTAQHPHLDARAAVLGQLGLPPASRLVGMVARLAPQKDHETLLRAAGRFLHDCPTAHLLIIGEHSESTTSRAIHDALRRLADEVGIGSRVTFTGFRRDIPHVLAALEVVVLATHFEGLPLVLLEAMAQARPIVATAVGGVPELIINDETGLLCRRRDPEQLAQAVLSVLTDEPRALRLAEGAQRLVKSRFTMERFSSAMAALYRDLLP
jgi:glycosyltransferase involved in cell wall biosynthesis